MEKVRDDLPDFDTWYENYKTPTINYLAAYDIETGSVLSVAPDYALNTERFKHSVPLPPGVAESIISGEIKMRNCFIDATSGSLEITEVKNLYKIDDVLHRIIELKWAEFENPEIIVTANPKQKTMSIELSNEYGGSYVLPKPIVERKIFWDGETVLKFLITNYNDPHIVHKSIEIKLSDLNNKFVLSDIEFPKNFSVFTRRLFKKYAMEIK